MYLTLEKCVLDLNINMINIYRDIQKLYKKKIRNLYIMKDYTVPQKLSNFVYDNLIRRVESPDVINLREVCDKGLFLNLLAKYGVLHILEDKRVCNDKMKNTINSTITCMTQDVLYIVSQDEYNYINITELERMAMLKKYVENEN
jgi:hypothetical protein